MADTFNLNSYIPRKNLGQNFLKDQNIIHKIVSSAKLNSVDYVVEIGPGQGALTEKLLEQTSGVIAIEVDPRLVNFLQDKFLSPKFILHEIDITKCDLQQYIEEAKKIWKLSPLSKWHIVANLPYNLSSPILKKLIKVRSFFSDFTLMLQREVVERISSSPGNKIYGYLSVYLQAYFKVRKLFDVSPQSFYPVPKVWSSVVNLTPHETSLIPIGCEEIFLEIISAAFSQRRKMLGKNLLNIIDRNILPEIFDEIEIDPKQRAETLSVLDFINLSERVRRIRESKKLSTDVV